MGLIQSGALVWSYLASGAVQAGHLASGALAGTPPALASRTLTDQTGTSSGVLAQAPATGLYRVTAYALVTQGGLLNAGALAVTVGWTDETQAQTSSPVSGVALLTSGAAGQGATVVRALSGTNIHHSVALGSLVGSPHYSAWAALERVL